MTDLPMMSLVTPCLNQAKYVEKALQSIHGQGYPYLEHVVMDGGSTDGSLEIIRRYADRIFLVSEPVGSRYQAIEKGFGKTTGDVMGWLNSDDIYLPGALLAVGEIFRDFPDVEWVTTRFPMGIDGTGALKKIGCFPGFSKRDFLRGDYLATRRSDARGFIPQESTFWRRGLWDRAGASFHEGFNFAADFELWSRFFNHSSLYGVDIPLGCSRHENNQETKAAFQKYLDEVKSVFLNIGGKALPPPVQKIRMRLVEACGTSVSWRRLGRNIGLIDEAKNITYDWNRSCWAKEQ